jgi:release factor glutamine methyltransferase
VTESASRNLLAQTLGYATQVLVTAGCDTPRLDAEVLLAHVLAHDRAWLYTHPEHVLSPPQLSTYRSLVSQRVAREPVAYLTGCKEFFGLDLIVTPDVLIPRPETEQLVELAIQWIANAPSRGLIADVGTGSGAVAVALAVHLPQSHIIATDTSPAALAVARRNAVRHRVANRVHCVQGDLLAPLARTFHLIVANPPYLSQTELATAPPEVACWEPRAALDGGPDGLAMICSVLEMASDRLCPGGALLVEIGAGQGTEVLSLARRRFSQATIEIVKDYAKRDRLLVVRCAGQLAKAPSL